MTSYIFLAIWGYDRTCGQPLFCQMSHWAKVLLPAKGCNLSHTWLEWPRPITACLLGSSVWQPVNQPGPLQEPRSWAARHRQHFIPNNLPAGLPLCRRFTCFVNISTWMKTLRIFSKNTFFFHSSLQKKSKTSFWSFMMQEQTTRIPSIQRERFQLLWKGCVITLNAAPLVVFCQSIREKLTHIPSVSAGAGFRCVFVISLCLCSCVCVCVKWIAFRAGCGSLVWQKLTASDRQMFLFR